MGKPAVILSVQKQPGADTVALTDEIEAALAEISPTPAGRHVAPTSIQFRQANFIETSIGNVAAGAGRGGRRRGASCCSSSC